LTVFGPVLTAPGPQRSDRSVGARSGTSDAQTIRSSRIDNRQFEFFDRFTPSHNDSRLNFALSDLRRYRPGTLDLIDVGCGSGSTLAYLASGHPLGSVTGIDPSSAYIDQARQSLEGVFEVGSILDPEVVTRHAGRYDSVVMASVLHHLVGRSRSASKRNACVAMAHCLDLLRPGGRLYVFEPTHSPRPAMAAAFWLKSIAIRAGGNRRIEPGRPWLNVGAPLVSYIGDSELRRMVLDAGGRLIETAVISERTLAGVVHRKRVGHTISV
jgi:SAM-dependent methyltransferase